jgi:STE24 endopeptidase
MSTRLRICAGLAVIVLGIAFCPRSEASASPTDLSKSELVLPAGIPAAAQASDHFDVDAATEAYLAWMPESAKSRSDAYFEGGYWLILWDFVYGVVIALLLLNLRWSAAMRNAAERITRFKPLQTFIYWAEYVILTFILGFPLAVYEGYIRERQYGLATQTLGPWMWDQTKALLVSIVLGGVVAIVLFGIVRRLPRTWWIWGTVVSVIFFALGVMLAPVYIFPIFNKITPMNDPKVTQPILSMARANGIDAHDVYQIDASRQTTRMSANVSGFGKTMRITMNDNLLRRGTPDEIEAIMGHEMGHYVLNHVYKSIIFFTLVILCFFGFLRWGIQWCLDRWGDKWQIRGIGDTAVLPLVALLASIFFFVLTPILNTDTRTGEAEADVFGLNASRNPDGFARAALHLGEYRKMRPGPVEEWIFFDHPSGYNRIHRAMQWKKENMELFKAQENGSLAAPANSPGQP